MIGTASPLEKTKVKVVDFICAPKESRKKAIFSSPMVPSSSNPPQPSTSTMPKNPNVGAAMLAGLNMAARLLRGLLPPMERQLMLDKTLQISDILG